MVMWRLKLHPWKLCKSNNNTSFAHLFLSCLNLNKKMLPYLYPLKKTRKVFNLFCCCLHFKNNNIKMIFWKIYVVSMTINLIQKNILIKAMYTASLTCLRWLLLLRLLVSLMGDDFLSLSTLFLYFALLLGFILFVSPGNLPWLNKKNNMSRVKIN